MSEKLSVESKHPNLPSESLILKFATSKFTREMRDSYIPRFGYFIDLLKVKD